MESWAPDFLGNKRTLWIVAALILAVFLITNLPWRLDDYDQAKQAFTSFEMIKEGHWLYQRTPNERIATKPPFVGWISAGLFATTRSWDVAWRLPSIVSAIALSFLMFRSASKAYGALAGLIALSAFGLNLLSPRLASLVRTDMPLALVVFLVGLQIWRKIRGQGNWTTRDRVILAGLLTSGMLIKGPILYAFLLPGIAVFQWWRRKSKAPSAWCGWWPWIASLAIFLAWVIGGSILVPQFFDQVVMREFVGRFGETVHRPQPIYFYWPHLLHKFAPWSILIIALAVLHLRSEKIKPREMLRAMSPETFWLVCWILGGLVVMSLIPSKRVDRIFPVVPPLCLLLGAQIARVLANEDLRDRIYRWTAVALLLALFLTGSYTLIKIFTGYRGKRNALVKFSEAVRTEAAAHGWHYEVVKGSEEGLLLYFDRLHFIEPERAVAEWNRGTVDALIAPGEEAPPLVRDLPNASLSSLRSAERKEEEGFGYVLITRGK